MKPMGMTPTTCQHYRIDNETWQCEVCGQRMIGQTVNAETVLSAPNAAPCRDPNHLAAMEAGEEFECSHPYVANMALAKTVVVGYDPTYECERCRNNGTIISAHEYVEDCGRYHRGARIRAARGVNT